MAIERMSGNAIPKSYDTYIETNTYEVQKGDTLSKIAKEHGVSLKELLQANPEIKNPDKIEVRQRINIPERKEAALQNSPEPSNLPSKSRGAVLRFENSLRGTLQRFKAETELDKPEPKKQEEVKAAESKSTGGASFTKEVPDADLKSPRSLEEQAKLYDKYQQHIPSDKLKTGTNEMNVVGMRHHDVQKKDLKQLRSYDDQFLVLWTDKQGNKRAEVFQGATHPGQLTSKGGFTDINKDGKADMAYIKPGTYDYKIGTNKDYGSVLREDRKEAGGKLQAWRDLNNDGAITGEELDKNFNPSAILFHPGFDDRPKSAGCQTMAPKDFERFIDLMKEDPNKKINYTLVDAS